MFFLFLGRFPALRRSEPRLCDAERLLYGSEEARDYVAEVAFDAHETDGVGEDRAEIYRYGQQIRSRTIPNAKGKERFYGMDVVFKKILNEWVFLL